MTNPIHFYQERKSEYSQKLQQTSRKLMLSSGLRLLVFLSICFSVYFFFGNSKILIPFVIGLIAVFIFLISRHSDLKKKKARIMELINLNILELNILKNRDFSRLPEGNEFDVEHHAFSRDIDLFGKKSFFQYVNRTALFEGQKRLAKILLSNDISNIQKKQEAIQELKSKAPWRQEYSATAKLVQAETTSAGIISWIKGYQSFVPSFIKWFPAVFSLLSVTVILAYYFRQIGEMQVLLWLFVGLSITGYFFKKVNVLSNGVSKAQDTFRQYHQLLAFLENEDFNSELMKELSSSIKSESKKASVILKEFSKAIDGLDQRNNFLFGFLANGFFLWDLRYAYRLEKWIAHYQHAVESWFNVVELTDAYNSLGNFAFNHPSYSFPKIEKEHYGISAKELGHPLLAPSKRVNNDFKISGEDFYIITGANMAGKSTFLRTVALQIMMANTGLPVCAQSCNYSPIKLITSMRTSDSLGDEESYFFSELKRLKFIVDRIEKENYFIILDEILKGTNSTDKAIGSKKFVQRLVATNSTGIIATHDLSLCEISNELNQIKNFYFDAEIIKDELHFDYHLKDGICKNMNASFLLRKMKIVEE